MESQSVDDRYLRRQLWRLENLYTEDINTEVRNRILVSVYAYAYEFENDSLISDHEFDSLSLQIRPEMSTRNQKIDRFFREHFDPSTGMWIHKHPELHKVQALYRRWYSPTR